MIFSLLKQAWLRYYSVRWILAVLHSYFCGFIIEWLLGTTANWFTITTFFITLIWGIAFVGITVISYFDFPKESWREHVTPRRVK